MRWKMMLGMVAAVGSLAATGVRAQGNEEASGATVAAQQDQAKSDRGADGRVVDLPTTVDAEGNEVAKPNPMSEYLQRSRAFEGSPIEMPLVDDFRADASATDGQAN